MTPSEIQNIRQQIDNADTMSEFLAAQRRIMDTGIPADFLHFTRNINRKFSEMCKRHGIKPKRVRTPRRKF